MRTSVEGVFAVGDARMGSVQRVAQAAGRGTAATVSMDGSLKAHAGAVPRDTVSGAYRYYLTSRT